jgi:hypothetical protein
VGLTGSGCTACRWSASRLSSSASATGARSGRAPEASQLGWLLSGRARLVPPMESRGTQSGRAGSRGRTVRFFEPLPHPSPSIEQAQPEWIGPPEGVLGGVDPVYPRPRPRPSMPSRSELSLAPLRENAPAPSWRPYPLLDDLAKMCVSRGEAARRRRTTPRSRPSISEQRRAVADFSATPPTASMRLTLRGVGEKTAVSPLLA